MADEMMTALEAAYLAGWEASGEGYNSEYPSGERETEDWKSSRDAALATITSPDLHGPTLEDAARNCWICDGTGFYNNEPCNGPECTALRAHPPQAPDTRAAIRAEAFEEAARMCDRMIAESPRKPYQEAAAWLAQSIRTRARALITSTKPEKTP
ncbi:hypothetical protein HN018_06695 [Lichenicola cladoniae]|uniref:Uncharacterized protein n=1 Tax=Lichenicola cladoniae TaxID=1484109 RepID=A0A6M8HN90_9PROT|nr:hypothetical protein [Lichenicola cladoniae]NPD67260.1 hypothetical protein [Acetobacteraceae bacterium]QKE89765.1 hypothetical protein HN018_06695 [Lichenicola cladoniae]